MEENGEDGKCVSPQEMRIPTPSRRHPDTYVKILVARILKEKKNVVNKAGKLNLN